MAQNESSSYDRRSFLSKSLLAGAAVSTFTILKPQLVRAGKERLRGGLVGCGGRVVEGQGVQTCALPISVISQQIVACRGGSIDFHDSQTPTCSCRKRAAEGRLSGLWWKIGRASGRE